MDTSLVPNMNAADTSLATSPDQNSSIEDDDEVCVETETESGRTFWNVIKPHILYPKPQ